MFDYERVLFIMNIWQLHTHLFLGRLQFQNKLPNLPIGSLSTLVIWCILLPFSSFMSPLWQYSTLWVNCLVCICNLISSLGHSLIRPHQNFLHNPDNVWLCPLWHAWEGTCTRADLQSERAPAPLTCRSKPLRSDPDCKWVKALTADSSISGLQRRKSWNEWQLTLLPTTLTSPLPCWCSIRIALPW